MVALAERFRFLRNFQPTMSAARARQAAEQADRPAYEDAVSSYAGLGHEELRAAALVALRERGALTAGYRAGSGSRLYSPVPRGSRPGDGHAPGDGEGGAVADRGAEQQPRRVSMTGVNGWYSANQLEPARHRVDRDEGAGQEGQEQQRLSAGCWRPRRLG